MTEPTDSKPERVMLFDGVCNFCDASVNFIIDHDPTGKFRFAALQSPVGNALAQRYGLGPNIETSVLIEHGQAYTRSTGALRIARHLNGGWPLLYALIVIPRGLRDWAYEQFAARRYKLFGRLDACRVPTPEVRRRFLDAQLSRS